MRLHIKQIVYEHENAPAFLKRKVTKAEMEKFAERAAVVHQCGQELCQSIPNCTAALVDKYIYEAYIKGTAGIQVEFAGAILEKSETFNLREISAVKELVRELSGSVNNANTSVLDNLQRSTEIEVDTFQLCMKQIQHDIMLMEVWKEKYSSFESGLFFQRNDWLRLRNDELQQEAKNDRCLRALGGCRDGCDQPGVRSAGQARRWQEDWV